MNWQFSVVAFYTLFVFSSLFFVSCNDPDEIGLGLEDDLLGTTLSDTFTITPSVVLMDALETSNLNFMPVGAYTDPEMGTSEALMYTRLKLIIENLSLGTNPVVDSIVLTLSLLDFYGDTTQNQTLDVFELDASIDKNTVYTNLSTLAYSNLLGTKTFTAQPKSSKKIKINLSNTFSAGDLAALVNNTQSNFDAAVKGLVIVPNGPPNGALLLVDVTDTSSTKLSMFFHNDEGDNTAYDFKFGSVPHFHSLVGNRSSIPFLSPLVNKGDEVILGTFDDRLYVQSGTGVMTKLMFPSLKNLQQLGNVLINRAELIITPIGGTTSDYEPINSLSCIRLDSNGNILKSGEEELMLQNILENQEGTTNNLTAIYNSQKGYYVIPLNTAIQQIALGNSIFGGLMLTTPQAGKLFSISGAQFEISHAASLEGSFNRLIFGSPNHSSENLKLKIYYTPLN